MRLSPPRPSPWTPRLAALAAAVVGVINVASALRPNIRWRGHVLLTIEPVSAMRLSHAFALPAGTALLLVAPYLLRRRRRAWQAAVGLMLALGLLDLFKGLDLEATAVTWCTGAVLAWARPAFAVRHESLTLRSAAWRVPALGAAALGIAAVAARASEGRPSWLPLSIHLIELGTLVAMAYVTFRPLAAPAELPGPALRAAATELVRAHGSDTLSFFKLRGDKHYFFSADGRAFAGYRIENGVLLLSGDPVGPPSALGGLLAQLAGFAQVRGLKLGAVGASERLRPLYEQLGLRTLYLGDEAILELGRFSLQGRSIRKVRQSVSRLRKAGFAAELLDVTALAPDTAQEVDRVLVRGRDGAPERGFSMAMDTIRGPHEADTLVIVARDGVGAVRGVLHFVPCYGRPAMSLSFMRRDPGTPNGLTEFLVVSAVELLRERGVQEISLNFAAFARWIHSPEKASERVLGKLISLGNPFFQIESLYRFNAKFHPRWEPRYLVYEGAFGLPRVSIATMWAEGQLYKPTRRRTGAGSLRASPSGHANLIHG